MSRVPVSRDVRSPDRAALADVILDAGNREACARVALEWLREQELLAAGLCVVVDDAHERLEAVASLEVSSAIPDIVHVPLSEDAHPLVLALRAEEPVEIGPASLLLGPDVDPPGEIVALPFERRDATDLAPGLLLAIRQDGGTVELEQLSWAARLIGTRIAALGYREQRRSNERLKRDIGWLSGTIEAVTDPILLTDGEGRILVANAAAEHLLSPEEEMGEGRRRAVALNNMLFSAALITAGQDGPGASRRELLLVDPLEGHDLLFELISTPIERDPGVTAVVSILHNVTDLRRATEQIEENYRRLRAAESKTRAERDRLNLVLNSVFDPIVVTDEGGNIVLMNPPAETLFTTASEKDEAALRRVRANDAVFSSMVSAIHAETSDRWRGELTMSHPETGAGIPTEAISSRVRARPGADTAVVTVLHDLTETKERAALYEKVKRHSEELREKVREATAELADQNELLRRQALELEHASAMKSQFLANVSHELRTPLNAMIGYVSILEAGVHGELNASQRERLQRVHANGRHLTSLLNDVLELERIEAGKMPVRLTEFTLPDLSVEVMSEVEPLIPDRGPEVRVEIGADLPPMRSDRNKIKQILINLMSNALKFTREGEVVVRAGYSSDTDRVEVAVADTGIGIPAEHHRTIFEAFGQADASYTRKEAGTGLGLSICARMAEVLGGQIGLESEVGKGSTFTLQVPRWIEDTH